MTTFVRTTLVDEEMALIFTAPRVDGVVAEIELAPGEFGLAAGPFREYSRTVTTRPMPGGIELEQQFRYVIAAPLFRWVLAWPLRRHLLRRPRPGPPWWAPPDRFDAVTAQTVSLLCIAAIITGYLGAVIGQTATFATDEFGAGDRAQGILLASVRAGAVITVAVTLLADRRGRKRLLVISMLAGCALTVAGAASPDLISLGVSQAAARGFATAIALLVGIMAAEVSPSGSRAYIASVITLTAGLGAGIPVWFLFVADLDPRGWRLLYLVAGAMMPIAVWIGRTLQESARFERHAATAASQPSVGLRRDRLVLVAAVAFLALLFAAPASQFRNEFLRDERGFSAAQVSLFILATNTPQGIGVALAGKLADRRGRRPVAIFTVALGTLTTVATFAWSGAPMWTAGLVAGLITAGAAPALGVYSAELFGTGRRGRANGIVNAVAVLGSVTGLILVGDLSQRSGSFATAFSIVAIGPMLVVMLVWRFFPESAGLELEELNPGED